jgi:AraC-like DNA-binding protein
MNRFYKYLPVSKEDEIWGLYVLNAGCSKIGPDELYPSQTHPSHHNFNWQNGRILNNEYQVIYITGGEGFFESASCEKSKVTAGSVIMLFPGEWHRFKPLKSTGWTEYWVGFNGNIIQNLLAADFFKPQNPILSIGLREDMLKLLLSIIETVREERTGYQPAASGALLHLLGDIYTVLKQGAAREDNIEAIINKARSLIRENTEEKTLLEDIAKELGVGYSWFRKAFKEYTGMAPGQYLIQLKIERAKTLLCHKEKTIKEIGYELNFESVHYFSRLFKEKTGISPQQYRQQFVRSI